MELERFLREVTALPGVPGYEAGVNKYIAAAFEPLADEVRIDMMQNVVARLGDAGPRVMISAHQDEIGLMVTKIENDGCLRFTRNGGVDPRILPAHEVSVQTQKGPVFGVIGAKPPHMLTPEERAKTPGFDDLFIDIGYPAETVKALVRVGDPVVFLAPATALADGRMASKTMDDRASVAAMLVCAEQMHKMNVPAQVLFVSSTQEEIGAMGAETAAYALNPDFAIAIDVTHGEGPGTEKWDAFDLDKVVITCGPIIHPMLYKKLRAAADKWHIPYSVETSGSYTGTDADEIQAKRRGIPTVLVSIPLKYMHTTVETLSLDVITEAGRLMALFIDDIAREWGNLKWY